MKVEFRKFQKIDVSPGMVIDVPDDFGAHLIKTNQAYAEGDARKKAPAPQPEPVAIDASDD